MLTKNALWSIAGGAIPAITALISIPILIASLGYQIFAITSLVISLTVFFFIYDFGIGRSVVFFTPKAEYSDSESAANLTGTAFLSSLFLGLIAALGLWYLSPFLASSWINVQPALIDHTTFAFQITAVGIVPSLLANTCKGVLEGRSKFKQANICKMFSGSTIFLAPLMIVVMGSQDILFISSAILASRFFVLMLYGIFIACILEVKAFRFSGSTLRFIYKYGVWAGISGFISTMFVYGDRFIVARYLTAQELSLYVASQDILIRYLLIPWSTAMVLMPVFSASTTHKAEARRLFHTNEKQTMLLSLAILILVLLATLTIRQLLSAINIPEVMLQIVAIQMVGVFFCAISQLSLVYLYARGKPGLITLIYSVEALIYLLAAPVVFKQYGIIGACIVWTSRLVIEFGLLRFSAGREIKHHA